MLQSPCLLPSLQAPVPCPGALHSIFSSPAARNEKQRGKQRSRWTARRAGEPHQCTGTETHAPCGKSDRQPPQGRSGQQRRHTTTILMREEKKKHLNPTSKQQMKKKEALPWCSPTQRLSAPIHDVTQHKHQTQIEKRKRERKTETEMQTNHQAQHHDDHQDSQVENGPLFARGGVQQDLQGVFVAVQFLPVHVPLGAPSSTCSRRGGRHTAVQERRPLLWALL